MLDGEFLRGEDAVEAFEGEGSFPVEEITDVGLLKACLMSQAAAGESATVDAFLEFQA